MENWTHELPSVVSVTCVGRWGACTQDKDVMFEFNKDLFLFSAEEERSEEVDSRMGAAHCSRRE